ncbi:hypothetical protein SLEP1_g52248 [Rubroshorea leprosula]|uniref:BFN domain-containing protein n=1 Tax=Rubroshorea leprosula TaxID=152421 RepID=A0AAV5M6K4_9ROSI|nr:hypothetical protein SLEP1_g52248 [Rubroshorea leprosula]
MPLLQSPLLPSFAPQFDGVSGRGAVILSIPSSFPAILSLEVPSPTIFLKISCDGDFLLPILVGDYAIERIIEALWGDDNGDSPDLFQFVKNVVEKLGYEVWS